MHTQVPAIERFSHNAATMPPHVGIVMKLGLLSLTAVQFIEMRSLSLSLSLSRSHFDAAAPRGHISFEAAATTTLAMRHARRALDLMPIGEVSSSERDTKPAWVPKCFCYVCEMSAEFISTFVQELGGVDYGVWRSRKVQIHEVDSKPWRKIYRIHPPRQTGASTARAFHTGNVSACSTLGRYPERE